MVPWRLYCCAHCQPPFRPLLEKPSNQMPAITDDLSSPKVAQFLRFFYLLYPWFFAQVTRHLSAVIQSLGLRSSHLATGGVTIGKT